ncbi:MAG: heme-binding protein [Acidimicrobiia bacterium]
MRLTSAIASRVVETIIERVGERGAAVAVVDDHGELLAFRRSDACPFTSITIAQNKAYTAARERRPSKAVGQASADEGFPMSNFGDPRMVTWGGGIPILVGVTVVGAVGVSGLPEQVDIELAGEGVRLAQALLT